MTVRIGWSAVRAVVGLTAWALLTSIGGAGIVLAPVTLPLLWGAGRYATTALGRALLNVVAVATAGELGWALAYAAYGEHSPLIWVVPLTLAAAVFVSFPLTQRAAERRAAQRRASAADRIVARPA
jgi:hypothetical protein